MSLCPRTFEPVANTYTQRAKTHTCALPVGHLPPHVCPLCGERWISEPGQRKNRVIRPGQATP